MFSERPIRASARQSAIRQQEQEAKLIAEQERRERIAARRLERRHGDSNGNGEGNTTNDNSGIHSPASSSRSLSPEISDSASVSGDDTPNENGVHSLNGTQQDQDNDPSRPFSDPDLPSSWEVAFAYGFLVKFKSLLRQNCPLHEFSIEDLEAGLVSRSANACIEEIHCNLLSNMLNRKKAVDSSTWQKVLAETMDSKYKTQEMEYDQNPLKFYGNYYLVPPADRIHILKALVHWVLQEGVAIRSGIEENNEVHKVEPYGHDQTKRIYWYFGEGTLRIYRETKNPKKKSTGWETVARNLEEIKTLADSFSGSTSKPEKALRERLYEEIINPTEDRIQQNKLKQERLEKRMLRLAELHQVAATRTTRTRSSNRLNQPKYTFDDDNEDDFEDEYDLYRRPSSRRKHNVGEVDQHEREQQQGPEIRHFDQQQPGDHEFEQRDSAEARSSTRSSVDRDSDTSIRDALQRTRFDDAEGSAGEDEDYRFEEDRDDDEPSQAAGTTFVPTYVSQQAAFIDAPVSIHTVPQPAPQAPLASAPTSYMPPKDATMPLQTAPTAPHQTTSSLT
ncbi:hypothetical protein BGZ99_010209 [Dissophora globulifera]|uniref:DDT domain-containing protein n=1 Tax=Dissophora globulifera TaxID=979702 RepID=A0A9P6R2L9_9FUNG|nr:hypothetical protein BGZ99_010209 [Dissophora globulifera]